MTEHVLVYHELSGGRWCFQCRTCEVMKDNLLDREALMLAVGLHLGRSIARGSGKEQG